MKRLITFFTLLAAFVTLKAEPVDIQWIDKTPSYNIGQSWGVPFRKGEVTDNCSFSLTDASGNFIPTQSWVMARHMDGSVKWMGFYATMTPEQDGKLSLDVIKPAKKKASKSRLPDTASIVKSAGADEIVIDNGIYEIAFPTSGSKLISRITMDGRVVVTDGQLVCKLEDRSEAGDGIISYKDFESRIEEVTVERSGGIAAVVKVTGMHKALKGTREWLPFTVRFYIYKDAAPIRMVHSFVFDGNNHSDYIKGLGVQFSIPFREEIQNRHVSFAGQGDGLWQEAVEPLLGYVFLAPAGGAPMGPGMFGGELPKNFQDSQFNGERVPNYAELPAGTQKNLDNWAKYNDYRLIQGTADGFTIQKRTGSHSTWFGTDGGNRARGFVLAGDVSGGLGVSLKNFWQSFPAELDADGMLTDKGRITVWMWSPSADAMDLRHYDIVGHDLGSSYEDWVEGYDTPYGIARTSELMLFPFSEMPSRKAISSMADIGQDILQLMPSPKDLHDAGAFGIWSLPDENGNDTRAYLERQIDSYLKYYEDNLESRRWYGFWNYGDVMHSYNNARHMWNYDHGGRAWHNTELESDLWLWYGFIRSGRPDFYRMATAMTRHTSEVDSYHIGPMKGLGTRHNVIHWGCGAKEARVGQAWWKRYYYYLTTDDRLGDLMSESVTADEAILEFDPLVRAQTRDDFPTEQPTRLRWGPDWTSLIGNWFTEWERTGEKKWLDKINAGMNSLIGLPNGLFTGKGPYGYDPATGVLTYEGDPEWYTNSNHLANLQGSMEMFLELLDGVGNKAFNDTYIEYAKWYEVPRNHPMRDLPENEKHKNWWGHWNIPRLLGFAAMKLQDEELAAIAWERFLDGTVDMNGNTVDRISPVHVDGTDILNPSPEDVRVSTNDVAQWNLDAIILPELIGSSIPSIKEIKPSRTSARPR